MDTIITVFTVLSMYLNMSSNVNNEHCYNAEIENGVVNTIYVYNKTSEYLTPAYSYHFAYDAQGRLTEKEAYKWNHETKSYKPYYKLQFDYTDAGYELSRCCWSTNAQCWEDTDEKMIYHLDNNQLQSVTYVHGTPSAEKNTVSHLFVQSPYEDYLLTLLATTTE